MGAESMRIAFFSTHRFDRQFFDAANQSNSHTIDYLESRLTFSTRPSLRARRPYARS